MRKILLASVFSIALTGCATVFDSGSKTITLTPSEGKKVDAEIYAAKGVEKVQLPTQYSAQRSKEDIVVKIVDKCYEETSHVVQSTVTNAFFGNILFGIFGLTGTTVDSSNGNMWTYDKSHVVITNKKDNCK
ncbi:MAG: hypothetical protein CMF61_04375 [Magnetococcales bacterium]|nr:hypothetical protein [Magnetococcales bacterium]|tara:strand:- start:377 stop:772 length:396 start_codon:yes stop_codon:yes gene_type:complete